jgi:hypothetical protein
MRITRYAMIGGGMIIVVLSLGMQSRSVVESSLLGPEVSGLRMGLRIITRNVEGKDIYDVRVCIRNTSSRPITLVGRAWYEGKPNNYAEWLKAEACFVTFPEILPPSAQTAGRTRTSPNPQTTISPGEEFTVSWSSHGRYLKCEDYYNTTPYFPSDGLYGVRARISLQTSEGKEIPLYSNEEPVSVGGSVALPKHGVAYVVHRDEEKQQVILSLGSHHRIVKGDQFHIMGRFPSGWMLTVTEVYPHSSLATVKRTGDDKDMEPLPPANSKAQLWEFGSESAVRESSVEEVKSIQVGMTRREVRALCHEDGGISSPFREERYILNDPPAQGPEGKVLKVKVAFKPADVSEEVYRDPNKFRKWLLEERRPGYDSPDDIVVSVSPSYWEGPYSD